LNSKFQFVSEALDIHPLLALSKKFGLEGKWKQILLVSGFLLAFVSIVAILLVKFKVLPKEVKQSINDLLFDKIGRISEKQAKKIATGTSQQTIDILSCLIFFRICIFVLYDLETKYVSKMFAIYKTAGIVEKSWDEGLLKRLSRTLRFEMEAKYDEYIADATGENTEREEEISTEYGYDFPPILKHRQVLKDKAKNLDQVAIKALIHKMEIRIKSDNVKSLSRKFIEELTEKMEARKTDLEGF